MPLFRKYKRYDFFNHRVDEDYALSYVFNYRVDEDHALELLDSNDWRVVMVYHPGIEETKNIKYVVPPHLPLLEVLPPRIFSNAENLKSLPEMPNVRFIGADACGGCKSLTTLPYMPELMSIDENVMIQG